MAPKGVDVALLESLVRAHFGPDFTCLLTWDVRRGRYAASPEPRRLAAPQTLFGVRIWWKAVGQFSYNLGFRLEVWNPEDLSRARALVEEYNRRAEGPRLEAVLSPMSWPASAAPRPA